jgi:4-amino-4-deoxy-L-arabinose transferase-like glycosyltransferase
MKEKPLRLCVFLGLIILVFFFLAIRFLNLSADVPARITWSSEIYGDEGLYARNAVAKTTTGDWLLPLESNPIVVMPLFQVIEYMFFKIMGVSLDSARLPGVLFFIITLYFVYLIYRHFTDRIKSLAVTLFISCNHLLFVYNRLALNENLMLVFAVIAVYLSLNYDKYRIHMLVLPLVMFCAVLAKISALSVWVPVVFLILYKGDNHIARQNIKRISLSLLLFVVMCIFYMIAVVKPYYDYGGYYLDLIPILPDSMEGLFSLVYAVYKIFRNGYLIMHGIYCIGYIAGIIGMILVFFIKDLKYRRMLMAMALWVIAYTVCGAVGGGYNPPRYYVFTVIPLISIMGFLIFDFWSLYPKHAAIKRVFLILVASAYFIFNGGRTISYICAPERSFSNMSDEVANMIRSSREAPVVITDIVDTYGLASGMLVLNLETGPADKTLKFDYYHPKFLITLGPLADNAENQKCVSEYASIEMLGNYDVFHNHHNGKPVYFYRLTPHDEK